MAELDVETHGGPALVLAFPGQGSLAPGVGMPWRDHDAFGVVREVAERSGQDLVGLLTTGDEGDLVATQNAQLCTFALSLCVLEATGLRARSSVAFGHSLGEYTALAAAGVLDPMAAADLVATRGTAMAAAAEHAPGTLIALIGADLDVARRVCARLDGAERAVAELEARSKSLGVRRTIRLRVGGAFHTPLMAPALEQLRPALEAATFERGGATVLANVDGQAHDDPGDWPELLARQLVEPVRFDACVRGLPAGAQVVECGPGSVLEGLISRIRDDVDVRSVGTPDELGQLGAIQ
jgi:[acyl-carrier-protein] S-malonyltransferase